MAGSILELIKEQTVLLDGGFGTELIPPQGLLGCQCFSGGGRMVAM